MNSKLEGYVKCGHDYHWDKNHPVSINGRCLDAPDCGCCDTASEFFDQAVAAAGLDE
jgi:hypothetical protein